ncbi:MAG TPA: FAD-binding oxidoreductase [Mesorhizobium sp.]|jgi:FAD/FMN-containing dehydrogenase|nr:FAD-binding oxidoreductase [Mesorhizobium sp.]
MTSEPPSPGLLDRFAAIVGPAHALRDAADTAPHAVDWRKLFRGRPALVLKPRTTGEVSAILKLATETGTPVVPQGGNTGLVGGAAPDASGRSVVLSTSRMSAIREIDTSSNTMTVEAGAVLHAVREAAEGADRLFPLSLASGGSAQVGGLLATNAGGTGVLAYGNARDLCLGLEVVLPTGEVLDDLRKLRKDNTGYDLKNLVIGAEGTLGVITAAVLKLTPRPRGVEVAWAGAASPEQALRLFELASGLAGPGLTGFELIGDLALRFALLADARAVAPLRARWPWHVLLELSSGRSAEDARGMVEDLFERGLGQGLVGDAALAVDERQRKAFWALREGLTEAQARQGASVKHDVAVPIASLPRFIAEAGKAVAAVDPLARVVCFGHMGDGNLHYNLSQPEGGGPEAFLAQAKRFNDAVHGVVRALGGSFAAEHGIGRHKRDELSRTAPPVALDLMRRIKREFDPAGIMNPGVVL